MHNFERPNLKYAHASKRMGHAESLAGGSALTEAVVNAGKKVAEVAKDAVDNVKDIIGISVGKSEGKKYKYEWYQGSKPLERSTAIAEYNNKPAKDPTIINTNISTGSSKDKPTQAPSRGLSVPNPNADAGMDYLYYFTGRAA
jgi:hypothetical protein